MARMSMMRRSGAGLVTICSGKSMNGMTVSPCASAGTTQSGNPARPSPASAKPLLSISRRVVLVRIIVALSGAAAGTAARPVRDDTTECRRPGGAGGHHGLRHPRLELDVDGVHEIVGRE